jgi:hypothetical protein
MTCMTALPDGTFFIANGAQIGLAGFRLSSEANHNALLYDPSKPVHQRFSMLANTTISRYYHSETVLLPDGRVLISGSDPETYNYEPDFPQEYRTEIFTPPYLMGNPIVPVFSNADKFWEYRSNHIITVTTGTVAKISLIGAVSSTHGNSMGQRTLFPGFSCSGANCTILAPPDKYICPPGWFQLFVIGDNGAPSMGAWVRIGGDPGNLGAWPAGFSDFNPPGMG